MGNTIIYLGIYKDSEREIVNDGSDLSFNLDGLKFVSDDLERWILVNDESYREEQMDKFSFSASLIRDGFTMVTEYTLADYLVSFLVPQRLFDSKSVEELEVDLKFTMSSEGYSLSMQLPDLSVIEELDIPDFETGLKKLIRKLDKNTTLFNCYTCRYSSYSIYGSGFFGTLLCYKNYKEKFLKIENKEDYSHIQAQGYESVQETNYCNEFQLPSKDQFLYK